MKKIQELLLESEQLRLETDDAGPQVKYIWIFFLNSWILSFDMYFLLAMLWKRSFLLTLDSSPCFHKLLVLYPLPYPINSSYFRMSLNTGSLVLPGWPCWLNRSIQCPARWPLSCWGQRSASLWRSPILFDSFDTFQEGW